MMPAGLLTIAHNLFLTEEERFKMTVIDAEIETIGICLPVWINKFKTSEPAEEVFCKYHLQNNADSESVIITENGFEINLYDKWKSLAQNSFMCFSHQNKIKNDDNEITVIHYINIRDIGNI